MAYPLDHDEATRDPLDGYQSYDYAEIAFTNIPTAYIVGTNAFVANPAVFGGLRMLISKRQLLYATQDCIIQINSILNTPITLYSGTWYTFEIRCIIIFVTRVAVNGTLRAFFEG